MIGDPVRTPVPRVLAFIALLFRRHMHVDYRVLTPTISKYIGSLTCQCKIHERLPLRVLCVYVIPRDLKTPDVTAAKIAN